MKMSGSLRRRKEEAAHVHRIRAVARLLEWRSPGRRARLALPNGHRLEGVVDEKNENSFKEVLPGEKVVVEMTPFDLSRGQILSRKHGRVDEKEPSAYGLLPSGGGIAGNDRRKPGIGE